MGRFLWDCPGGPEVITRIFIREKETRTSEEIPEVTVRERQEDGMLTILKLKDRILGMVNFYMFVSFSTFILLLISNLIVEELYIV